MRLVTSTCDFKELKDYVKQIECLYEAGFRNIDLSMYTPFDGDPLFGDGWKEYAEFLLSFATEKGMKFTQAHGPNVNNMDGERGFEDAVWKTRRAIEVCGILGIPNVVVHAGWDRNVLDKDVWFEENRKFFRELFEDMERCGVNVLCENTTKANMPTWYYLITGADMRAFIDFVDHPRFGGCWDTGHANVEGNQYHEIMALGDKLFGIHFNDNRGKQDEHITPFMGTMNVDEVMHALSDVGYKGDFTFECDSGLRPGYYWLGNRRKFAEDSRLFQPPLALKIQAEKLLYEVGKYILTTYGLFEEV